MNPYIRTYMNNKLTYVSGLGNGLALWFSYETIVAFEYDDETVVCENIWTRTTGRHLSYIDNDDKKSRLPWEDFRLRLQEALAGSRVKQLDKEGA